MGGSQSSRQKEIKKQCADIDPFCVRKEVKETFRNNDSNEIILSKTYTYPKGTFTAESIEFFTEKEILLFHFSQKENVAAVRFLTIKGVNISILDQERTSPLHIACRSGSLQLVEEIINQGAMINIPDIVGWTPLHIACYCARPDVILLLLKNGASYTTKNRDGLTPMNMVENNQECFEIIQNFILYSQLAEKEEVKTVKRDNMDVNELSISIEDAMRSNASNNTPNKNQQWAIPLNMGHKNLNQKVNYSFNEKNNNQENEEEKKQNEYEKKIKDAKQEILGRYKFIPKRHKFYLTYKFSATHETPIVGNALPDDNYGTIKSFNFADQKPQIPKTRTHTDTHNTHTHITPPGKNWSNYQTNQSNQTASPGMKSLVKVPNAFPEMNSINNLNEYFGVENNKNNNNNNNSPMRHSHNFSKHCKSSLSKGTTTLPPQTEWVCNTPFLLSQANEKLEEGNNNTLEDYIQIPTLGQIKPPRDSEFDKYKIYDDISHDSDLNDDSFQLDSSMIGDFHQTQEEFSKRQKKVPYQVSNRFTSRNKSYINMMKGNTSAKNGSRAIEIEEDTICVQGENIEEESEEDSEMFSEEVANYDKKCKPNFPIGGGGLNYISNIKDIGNYNCSMQIFIEKETNYFLAEIKLSDIFFKVFKCEQQMLEKILLELFLIDCNFSILFTLNLFGSGNYLEKFVHILRHTIIDKELKAIILTSEYRNNILCNELGEAFFNSFDFEKTNLRESIQKCFSTIRNDMIQIDRLCKFFSDAFFRQLSKNEDKSNLRSCSSIYHLVFTLILFDVCLKEDPQSSQSIPRKKYFCDMIIILKNLNEGENYEKDFIKNCIKFLTLMGYSNFRSRGYKLLLSSTGCQKPRTDVGLFANGKFKQYSCIYFLGVLVLFLDKKSEEISKMILMKVKHLYKHQNDERNSVIKLESQNGRKNILVFKNKTSFIKYRKHSSIFLKFSSNAVFDEIAKDLNDYFSK